MQEEQPPTPNSDDAKKADKDMESWKQFGLHVLDSVSLAVARCFNRPSMTMGVYLPASFFVGRFGLVSTPFGVIFYVGLMGLAYMSHKQNQRARTAYLCEESEGKLADAGSAPPLWEDPAGFATAAGSSKESIRERAESAEWLNGFVRHLWLRYPSWVGDWLIRDAILGEILEGLKRDKVLPAGPIKDIQCTKVILRESSPWVLNAEVVPSRSRDELVLIARVRFVSDKDAGVELKIKGPAGIIVPVKIEQISVETTLCLRFYLQEEPPFIRVIWLSMTERPNLDLAVLPMGGMDIMHIPGLDTMLHDIIMQGIQQEIVLPAGKIIALKPRMPDNYYKEWGPSPSPLDEFVGELVLTITETRIMRHPAYRENAGQDLYIRVNVDSKQVQRSHKICDTMSERGNFRFVLHVPFQQPAGGSRIEMHLICAQRGVTHAPLPLGAILVSDVVAGGKFAEGTWLNVEAITNGAIQVRCRYGKFGHCFKTIKSQHSNMKEFCGGTSDWRPEGSEPPTDLLTTASDFAKLRAGRQRGGVMQRSVPPPLGAAGSSAAAGSSGKAAAAQEEYAPNWHEMLARRQFKEVLWVTVHGASNLISKFIGTRDPYIRLVVGDQAEKTSPKVNTTNPKWEETMCFFLTDTAINQELTVTAHQDDVSRGYHVVDDAIGTYAFSMRQLKTSMNGAWSGVVGLKKVRSGKVNLTMSISPLADAVVGGKQRESSGLSDVEIEGQSGIAESTRISQPVKSVEGIVQIKVLRARCQVYDKKRKNWDKVPHPYLKVAAGNGSVWQNDETRVIRATKTPVFNEYFEFLVRDMRRDQVVFSLESRDGFFTEVVGALRVPMMAVARGQVLQRWMVFRSEAGHKASVLLEMRVSLLEWEGQDPPSARKWKAVFAEEHQRSSLRSANSDLVTDNVASCEDAEDSDWNVLVDLSKSDGGVGDEREEAQGGEEGDGLDPELGAFEGEGIDDDWGQREGDGMGEGDGVGEGLVETPENSPSPCPAFSALPAPPPLPAGEEEEDTDWKEHGSMEGVEQAGARDRKDKDA